MSEINPKKEQDKVAEGCLGVSLGILSIALAIAACYYYAEPPERFDQPLFSLGLCGLGLVPAFILIRAFILTNFRD